MIKFNNCSSIRKIRARYITLILTLIFIVLYSLLAKSAPETLQLTVTNIKELHEAVTASNKRGGYTTINLTDGLYFLNKSLVVEKSHITIKSYSGDPEKVILEGNGMKATNGVDNLLDIRGKYVTLTGLTLQNSGNHLIQLRGENDADYFKMNNCILRDSFEQLFKVTSKKDGLPSADYGVVKNTLFEYSAGIGPQFYIGGIDLHSGKNWLIENNTFRNIASPSRNVAEHAIHIWKNSANNIVKDNLIVNCDRGIGFGLSNQWFHRNKGGEITGNVIIHHKNGHQFADVGIGLEFSPGTKVINNTIYMLHDYPNAIEFRYKQTVDVLIIGNFTNKSISSRDGAQATLKANVTRGL